MTKEKSRLAIKVVLGVIECYITKGIEVLYFIFFEIIIAHREDRNQQKNHNYFGVD